MHVLLTGATGTVGTEVIKLLTAMKNIRLTVFELKNPRTKRLLAAYRDKIDVVWGNISNPEDIKEIPENLNAVIHLAAVIPPLADDKPDLAKHVNITGTQNIIQHLEKTSPNVLLLYSSSVAVYGDRIENPDISVGDSLCEGTEDVYAQTKIAAENLIQHSTLDWSIFRLTAIMKNHKMSKLMFHMPLSTQMEICTPADTARAFVNALTHRAELNGQIYNLGGGKSCYITFREFLEKSFQIFGLGAVNFPDHAFAERNFHCGIFADGDKLEEILHFRKDSIETYFEDQKRSVSVIVRLISSLFRVVIKQGLVNQSEPLKAYRQHNVTQMNRFFFPERIQHTAVHL